MSVESSESMPERWTVAQLAERAGALRSPGRRHVLGITGPPGAGKSTLAERLVRELGTSSVLVPMDGFHLSKSRLSELGRLDRMGAPDTFDADAYVATLRRLRHSTNATVSAPGFDREVEAAIEDAIRIRAGVELVITEGNYLLLDYDPWSSLRELLDEVWYVELGDPTRLERLIARHISFGKAPDDARAWSLGTDEANAKLVSAMRGRADLIVSVQD